MSHIFGRARAILYNIASVLRVESCSAILLLIRSVFLRLLHVLRILTPEVHLEVLLKQLQHWLDAQRDSPRTYLWTSLL